MQSLWDDEFWLPPNVTWSDLEGTRNGINFRKISDLWYPLFGAGVILVLRFVIEQKLARPIGIGMGMKANTRRPPRPNPILEKVYEKTSKPEGRQVDALAKQTDLSTREVELWFRKRWLASKPSTLDKFCESFWRSVYYTALYAYSWIILWDKSWFWDITNCWHLYPLHPMTTDVWWYYMVELAFYWSLLCSQFFDAKRSDFYAMFTHHVATILLLSLSLICNLFRVGTLVLWVHDCADVFLETAKAFKYAKYPKTSDVFFYFFAISWIATRLGYFPTWILYSITVEAPQFIQYYGAYNVFSGLLSILLILNLFWAYHIFKMAYLGFMAPDGRVGKDSRSDSEDESDSPSHT
ncbi:hypothetical protein TCAL_04534 [Tigriopus californicus]|uniref:TLC domain-containing protein n=1 Tax=Tigriopus californicus TaxID=6832 RepID=A0A553PAW5_TIGCA|nr:ceramide synthase 6-like [Tigriopus californicus]TRY74822.1 hypothetical protein TCAL_04534 [Tigriopus californicus]|eukprot:TCALIF_04534-PA protein Name:"Similar to CERS6 Ceramide synthase 6 (Homo sapiens)" AED:0.03 eAED:0.03 QI:0/-1/0/1/-1/1/1/0/351